MKTNLRNQLLCSCVTLLFSGLTLNARNIASEFCGTEIGHFNTTDPTTAPADSRVLLTVTNTGENSMLVKLEATGDQKLLDFLQVNVPAAYVTGSDTDEGGESALEVVVTFDTAPETVNMEILWSNPGWPGRWMVQGLSVPFAAKCGVASDDTEAPVMKTVELVGEPTFSSVTLKLEATDNVTSPITRFILNDAANGITDKIVTADENSQVKLTGLNPAAEYNLAVKARDNAGNISQEPMNVTFNTAVRLSECTGQKGHFAPDDAVKRINYEITHSDGKTYYTLAPIDAAAPVRFALMQIDGVGYEMSIAEDGANATHMLETPAGTIQRIRFLYNLEGMAGNEQTADDFNSDQAIFYITGECLATSLENNASETNVSVYPNPATESLTVSSAEAIRGLEIYTQAGMLLKSVATESRSGSIGVSDLTEGVYLLHILHESGAAQTRSFLKK